ncbi:MAG: DUF2461 domain-containing protein [Bacteroidetes bacterium]|nr:DUF2461 domain-containing protein [Bacteroidota bacterium]
MSQNTVDFLAELSANNNREWFNANKRTYEEARNGFEIFIDNLIRDIASFDNGIGHRTARESIFRIYRDVRFSADKSPYKTHFGAFLSPAVSKTEIHSYAGYYIHIEPNGASILAGGAYMPDSEWLKGIRREILYNGAELSNIISKKEFKSAFGDLEGEKLKKPPKDFPPEHPYIELLKMKSFTAIHTCSDDLVVSDSFGGHCVKVFQTLYSLNRFLNECRA